MDWIVNILGGVITQNLGGILAAIGGIFAVALAFFAGSRNEKQKGRIRTQEEIIDAHEDRETVEDRLRRGGATERDRQRMRYTRDE